MRGRRWIAEQLRRRAGIFVTRAVPRGVDLAEDVRRFLPQADVQVILDVGGHHGESIVQFRRVWPSASIYTFEPSLRASEVLAQRHGQDPKVHVRRVALSREPRQDVPFHVRRVDLNSSLDSELRIGDEEVIATELVNVDTVDQWCLSANINRVDLLKVDTEGSDLDVLRGATAMLSSRAIRLVQVEASMSSENKKHVPYEQFVEFLRPLNYGLFGIYDQFAFASAPVPLRRANLVFCARGTGAPE